LQKPFYASLIKSNILKRQLKFSANIAFAYLAFLQIELDEYNISGCKCTCLNFNFGIHIPKHVDCKQDKWLIIQLILNKVTLM